MKSNIANFLAMLFCVLVIISTTGNAFRIGTLFAVLQTQSPFRISPSTTQPVKIPQNRLEPTPTLGHYFAAPQVYAFAPQIINISSKGIYKVKLGWNSPISVESLPKGGFSMYIQFTNATSPPGTAKAIPNKMLSGLGSPIVSVKSFDMTIYDNHGRVLWSRVNQVPFAGGWWSFEIVAFPQVYNGNITISINNIKSLLHGVPTDSVDFAAKVV